ncbi:MAG: ribosomal RNA small subunit methyltransferase A [Bacteroidales bacterium]|nr:ribosomal RNA small subunit methyltransferase A [Bacteroidales bacterium]
MGVLTQYLLTRTAAPSRLGAPDAHSAPSRLEVPAGGSSSGSGVLLRSDKKILASQTPLASASDPITLKVVEIDSESVVYLREHYPALGPGLLEADFLKLPLDKIFAEPFSVIGNFPYNISSQIFFHILDYRDLVPEVVCMIQKEVAERLAAGPGSKVYGILSVLLQMWYDIEYRFTVGEGAFVPPPKVKSAVIRLTRNARTDAGCDEALLRRIVKATFNQRRKTIRNGLRSIGIAAAGIPFLDARPEQLSVEDFITLTRAVTEGRREA